MSDNPPRREPEAPGPTDFSDPKTFAELHKATVWIGLAVAVALLWMLTQPLLLIVGGLVFASMLDGGARLLGRVTRIGRAWRLAIVCVAVLIFLAWVVFFAGATIAAQFDALQTVVQAQIQRILDWAHAHGIAPPGNQLGEIGKELLGSVGKLTSFVGSALGAISSLAMIVVLGVFIATEPRLYERGLAWMLPMSKRQDFYRTTGAMGHTLRRLMFGRLIGMTVEGVFVGVALSIIGVPMAVLLGILTGLLAFLPNIGAIVSGALIVLVGFSQGANTGFLAAGVYVAVQMLDGYLIVPMVARKSVDLAPALVLGAQILLGALFGILGLALADPIVAMLKVFLESSAEPATAKSSLLHLGPAARG